MPALSTYGFIRRYKSEFRIYAGLLFLLFFFSPGVFAQQTPSRPEPFRYVNDMAGILSNSEQESLEEKLSSYSDTASIHLMVVILKSIPGQEVNRYAARLTEEWGLAEKRNLILFLIDYSGRKYAIVAGSDKEKVLPQDIARKIEENHLRPHFKRNNYYQGLHEATGIAAALVQGKMDPDELKMDSQANAFLLILLLLIFIMIVFPIIQYRRIRKSHLSSRPIGFVASLSLMNRFGAAGRNYESFAAGSGHFMNRSRKFPTGGGGAAGSW